MIERNKYGYESSIKSRRSDELINTYAIRPAAGLIVRFLYATSVTPNQVTIAATAVGLLAAVCFGFMTRLGTIAAGILIEFKDVLDSADGQLARAKRMYSRRGRFLDSLGDIVVNAALFLGVAVNLGASPPAIILAFSGFIGMTLRVSYHVYYQVQYLHLEEKYPVNRPDETITDADRESDPVDLQLQKVYIAVYGWQDRLMSSIDRWCLGAGNKESLSEDRDRANTWYGNSAALRLSGAIGLGTELALFALCALFGNLWLYLWLNLLLMNSLFTLSVVYRKYFLSKSLSA